MADNKLKKELSLMQVIAMAAGGMIAAWMVEIKLWFEMSGTGSLFALMTCALLVLSLCYIYAEMTAMLPYAGGANVWVSNAFGWNLGWFACWGILLLYIMAMPTVSYGIASMIGYIRPINFIQVKTIATVILLLWFFLTSKEIKIIARLQSLLFWSTLCVSVVASLIFIFSGSWSLSTALPLFPEGVNGYTMAVGLLVMKFIGFDLIPQLVEESTFPREKMIKAFVGALLLTLLIYGLAIIGVSGIVSREWIMQTDIVDPRVADILGMHWLGLIIVVMGALTCLTTLSGFWLSAARTLYGAAKQRQFSNIFTKINKNGQPVNANVLVGIFAIYFTVFAPESWVNYIYTIYGMAAGIVYFLVVISFIKLRKIKPEWERPYKVKRPILVSVVGLIFVVWVLISSTLAMDLNGWVTLGAYVLVGVAIWGFTKRQQKKDPKNWVPFVINPENTPIEDN